MADQKTILVVDDDMELNDAEALLLKDDAQAVA